MTAPDVAVCRGGTVGGADPTAVQVDGGLSYGRRVEAPTGPDESGGPGGRLTDDGGEALAYTTGDIPVGSRGTIPFYGSRPHPAVRTNAVVAR